MSQIYCTGNVRFGALVTATTPDPPMTNGEASIVLPTGYSGTVTLNYHFDITGTGGQFAGIASTPPPPVNYAYMVFNPYPTTGTQFQLNFKASVSNSGGTRMSTTSTTFTAR
jgi:hypothetical protein